MKPQLTVKVLFPLLTKLTKNKLFILIVIAIAILGTLLSIMTRVTVLQDSSSEGIKLAVIAPFSGTDQSEGDSLLRGAELLAQHINRQRGVVGKPLKIVHYDDANNLEQATKAIDQAVADGVVAVIGHWSPEVTNALTKRYAEIGLPLIVPSIPSEKTSQENAWVSTLLFDEMWEARFLANYVRNILDEKLVSVIRDDGQRSKQLAVAFDETLRRFGTKLVHEATFDAASRENKNAQLDAIVSEFKEKKLPGVIFIAASSADSAAMLHKLRKAGVMNRVVGSSTMATIGFKRAVSAMPNAGLNGSTLLNGTLVTAPMLFDTGNELAQKFGDAFHAKYGERPDWVAAYGYEAARLLNEALSLPDGSANGSQTLAELRQQIKERLIAMNAVDKSSNGINGQHWFDAEGAMHPPVRVGLYNGAELISSMVQLQPILDAGVTDYLDELIAGRALYVNDRFMYKTNVVYTGMQMLGLTKLEKFDKTIDLDFFLWFRYQSGKFEPQELVFTNAVEPIKLDKPEKEIVGKEMTYRMYRVKGKFYFNYSKVEHPYGTLLIGFSFIHRQLSQNNLMYVSDVLGMNLRTVGEGPGGWIQSMKDAKILKALSGWRLSRAWVSQEKRMQSTEGSPAFVGYGKPQPLYSEIDHGIVLEPDRINVRDLFPEKYWIYLAIFALVAAIAAELMDRKERGQFWKVQTLGLRLLSWPAFLASVGNLSIEYGIKKFSVSTVDMIVLVYDMLWWVTFARLLAIIVERFMWIPLEIRTGNKIPNLVRMLVSFIIYLLAFFGIIAFVFDKQLTSLLATSGLLAMIVGMAINTNLANIFSGIFLNIERPFVIGDYIKIGELFGQITDITWRTMRIRHIDGYEVSMPNGAVSAAQISNFSATKGVAVRLIVHMSPAYPPGQIRSLMEDALKDNPHILSVKDDSRFQPNVFYQGYNNVMGTWVNVYLVKFWTVPVGKRDLAIEHFYDRLRNICEQNGISYIPAIIEPGPGLERKVALFAPGGV